MKEYAILAVISVFYTLFLDWALKTDLVKRIEYYIFLAVIFGFKLLVNGYLTGSGIVLYNPHILLGIRIGTIPLEDFFFGFSMVTMTIIFWETFKAKL